MGVIICRPETFLVRRIAYCPTCKQRRHFAGHEAVWYGTAWSCCGCGDTWSDGERRRRPFRQGWRKEAIAKARRAWDEAGPFDRAAYEKWCREQLGEVSS